MEQSLEGISCEQTTDQAAGNRGNDDRPYRVGVRSVCQHSLLCDAADRKIDRAAHGVYACRGVSVHAQQIEVSAAPCHLCADLAAVLFQVSIRRAPKSILEYCTHWNVMFTLAVALAALIIIESQMPLVQRMILTGCCISLAQFGDWSYMIPVWTIIFYVFRDSPQKQAVAFAVTSIVLETIIFLPQYVSFLAFFFSMGHCAQWFRCRSIDGMKREVVGRTIYIIRYIYVCSYYSRVRVSCCSAC